MTGPRRASSTSADSARSAGRSGVRTPPPRCTRSATSAGTSTATSTRWLVPHSRNKGKAGELEVRDILLRAGWFAKRGWQEAQDVTHSIPGVHMEVKRRETLDINGWLRQADSDALARSCVPWLVFRRNKQPWRVVVPLDYLLTLVRAQEDLRILQDASGEEASPSHTARSGEADPGATRDRLSGEGSPIRRGERDLPEVD